MGCRTCGSKSKRFSKDVPILDSNNKVIAKNYEKFKNRSLVRPARIRIVKDQRPNTNRDSYPNLTNIQMVDTRINVLTYDPNWKCIYIVGYMEGCGSCNYMRRLINKIMTTELKSTIHGYILDKRITDPAGFAFSGNPTILFVDHGKLVFQVGGVFNRIGDKIQQYYMR